MLPEIELDALSLEYKLSYGCATGNLDLSDVVNHPRIPRVFGGLRDSLEEQFPDLLRAEVAPVANDSTDLSLVGLQAVQSFD